MFYLPLFYILKRFYKKTVIQFQISFSLFNAIFFYTCANLNNEKLILACCNFCLISVKLLSTNKTFCFLRDTLNMIFLLRKTYTFAFTIIFQTT